MTPSRADLVDLVGRPVRITKVRTKGPDADYPTVTGDLLAIAGHVDDGSLLAIVRTPNRGDVAIPVSRIAAIGANA